MRNSPVNDQDAGFTLLEVIVSFLILALTLAVVNISIMRSARLYSAAEEKQNAIETAKNLLLSKVDDGQHPKASVAKTKFQLKAGNVRINVTRIDIDIKAERGNRVLTVRTYEANP